MSWRVFWSSFAGVFLGSVVGDLILRRSDDEDDEREEC